MMLPGIKATCERMSLEDLSETGSHHFAQCSVSQISVSNHASQLPEDSICIASLWDSRASNMAEPAHTTRVLGLCESVRLCSMVLWL